MSELSNNSRIAKNSVYMSIRLVIVLIVTLFTTRKTLEILGVIDYGINNVVCGFVSMFTFLNTSLSNGIQRFFNYEFGKNGERGASKVFNSALQIQMVLSIIIVVLTEIIGMWYLYNKMVFPGDRLMAAVWIFHFSVLNMALLIIQAPFIAAIMAHEKMDFYSILSVLDVLLKLIAVLLIPYFNSDSLVIYGLSIFIISLINFIAYICYSYTKFPEVRVEFVVDKKMLKNMLSFSGWNIFGSFSTMMREHGVNLIMNLFFGPAVNAARGVAGQVNGALQGFASNLLTPVRPQVIQSYAQSDYKRAFNLTFTVGKLSAFFVVVIAVPVCIEMDYILYLWLGNDVPEHTSTFVVLILATTIISILMGSMATIVHASGKMMWYQLIGGMIKILPVPVSFFILKYVTAPEYALVCVFVFTFIGYIVGLFIIKRIVNYSIRYYLLNVLMPVVLVTMLSYFIISPCCQLISDKLVQLLIILPTGCLIGILLSYSIGLNKKEKQYVNSLVYKFLHK